ncbi:hypothetical protein GR160_09975 [Flavobacterium sp. Sd200]|uniref:PH domain-containing protein n=1 Tax=Flavobacterium sp. Sd200 TaxID=2692211 RepID=UPI001368DF74|nr:PH domain-containing protein [Flavobacterium sp. Sd200]MXN91556.1 hypothetical protein [Flavobacterium sp. Sd200]
MKVYRSKIGKGMVSVLLLVYIGCSVLMLLDGAWPGIFFITPVFALIGYTLATTYYTIKDETLKVRSGFFYNKSFDIKSFRKIIKTNSLITAPAASNNRIEIFFNGYDSVVISPKEKEAFIAHLKSINPDIIYTNI